MVGEEEKIIKNASTYFIMKEFSGQVKNVNAERVKPPRPDAKK